MNADFRDSFDHPLGRLATVVVGVVLVYAIVERYPTLGPLVEWAIPAALGLWGLVLLSRHSTRHRLTLLASVLLLAGAITRAWFQLATTTELVGAIANLVPLLGILTELYASHYRTTGVRDR